MVHTVKHRRIRVKRKSGRLNKALSTGKRASGGKGKAKGRGKMSFTGHKADGASLLARTTKAGSPAKTSTRSTSAHAKTQKRVRTLGISNRNPLE